MLFLVGNWHLQAENGGIYLQNIRLRRKVDYAAYKDKYSKHSTYYVVKRVMDIVGSSIGMILLSPIMLITAIAIKLNSKGGIIFSQERVGKHGVHFKMYKFRSMVVNAEELLKELKDKNEVSGPMFKMKEDPRITTVGKFIRKTSIDELPQLFNVLKGDMSLVGPRPNLPREVKKFDSYHELKIISKTRANLLLAGNGQK